MKENIIARRIDIEREATDMFLKYKDISDLPRNTYGARISASPRYVLDTLSLTNVEEETLENLAEEYASLSSLIHKKYDDDREALKDKVLSLVKLNSSIDDFSQERDFLIFGRAKKQVDSALFHFIKNNCYSNKLAEFRDNLMFELECCLSTEDCNLMLSYLNAYFELSKNMHYQVTNK